MKVLFEIARCFNKLYFNVTMYNLRSYKERLTNNIKKNTNF